MTTTSAPPLRFTPGGPERAGAYLGIAMVICLGLGFAVGGFIPPLGADEPAAEIAAFYREDVDLRRVGVILLIVGGTLWVPFGVAIANRLGRIEGLGGLVVFSVVAASAINAVILMVFGSVLLALLLVPDMPDTTYQVLHNVVFVALIGLWQPGALQAGATGVGVLCDRSPDPAFPRWVGWFSLWMAFGSLMGSLIPFMTSGPFAWDGFMGFFIAACPFFAWLMVMCWCLLRAGGREAAA